MSTARTDTAEQRSVIYDALAQRNRLVGILRIGLPLIGAVVLAALLLQLFWSSLAPDFGFANLSIDRDNLVVDSPSYAGVGTDGTTYRVEAASARAGLGDTDLIHMTGARFTMTQVEGSAFVADAESAQMRLSRQMITVSGLTRLSGDSGVAGTVADAQIDIDGQSLVSDGPADLAFSNGATLKAERMAYDGNAQVWTFSRVSLVLPSMPGEESYALRPGVELLPGETPQ